MSKLLNPWECIQPKQPPNTHGLGLLFQQCWEPTESEVWPEADYFSPGRQLGLPQAMEREGNKTLMPSMTLENKIQAGQKQRPQDQLGLGASLALPLAVWL